MSKQIAQLKQLGLDEKEARVYLAALEFGPTTVAKLSSKSGVKRTTVYEFLDDLVSRGVILSSVSGKRRLYSAIPPEDLHILIERQKEALQGILPELVLLSQRGPGRPKIRLYEGVDELKHIYSDMTSERMRNGEVLYFANFEEEYKLFPDSFWRDFTKRRVGRKIRVKGIMSSGEYAEKHTRENEKELRESITLPEKDFPIADTVLIYENKVAVVSLGDERVGFIVESARIADTKRAIFNAFWNALKQPRNNADKNTRGSTRKK